MPVVTMEVDDEGVAALRLDRPDVLNATNLDLARDLADAVRRCGSDSRVRSVVLAGEGRAFCAGIDLTGLADGSLTEQFYVEWDTALWALERLGKPVVAAIHGHCVGAGLQLAITTDARVSTPTARYAMPAAVEGLVPGLSIHRLPRLIGLNPTRRLVLFGDVWSAATAAGHGLVDEVVTDVPYSPDYAENRDSIEQHERAALMEHAHALAVRMQEGTGTNGFAVCKRLLSLRNEPAADLFGEYLDLQRDCAKHPDHLEALEAWRRDHAGAIAR